MFDFKKSLFENLAYYQDETVLNVIELMKRIGEASGSTMVPDELETLPTFARGFLMAVALLPEDKIVSEYKLAIQEHTSYTEIGLVDLACRFPYLNVYLCTVGKDSTPAISFVYNNEKRKQMETNPELNAFLDKMINDYTDITNDLLSESFPFIKTCYKHLSDYDMELLGITLLAYILEQSTGIDILYDNDATHPYEILDKDIELRITAEDGKYHMDVTINYDNKHERLQNIDAIPISQYLDPDWKESDK